MTDPLLRQLLPQVKIWDRSVKLRKKQPKGPFGCFFLNFTPRSQIFTCGNSCLSNGSVILIFSGNFSEKGFVAVEKLDKLFRKKSGKSHHHKPSFKSGYNESIRHSE